MIGCASENGGEDCGCNRSRSHPVTETGRQISCNGNTFFSRCSRCSRNFGECTCFREGVCYSCCTLCRQPPKSCCQEPKRCCKSDGGGGSGGGVDPPVFFSLPAPALRAGVYPFLIGGAAFFTCPPGGGNFRGLENLPIINTRLSNENYHETLTLFTSPPGSEAAPQWTKVGGGRLVDVPRNFVKTVRGYQVGVPSVVNLAGGTLFQLRLEIVGSPSLQCKVTAEHVADFFG